MALRQAIDYVLSADPTGLLTALAKSEKALKDVDRQGRETDDTVHKSTKSMGDRFEAAGAKMTRVGQGLTLGVSLPMAAAFGMAANAAADDAEAQEILARNLKQSTGASDEAVESAEDYVSELSRMSGVADDELRPALSKLAQATGDQSEAQDLLAVALDTSVSKGKPLDAVAQALGRAYQGNTTALGRLGVATKDAEGKALTFGEILANLKGQVDGAAEAAGETGAGGMRRAKVAFEELQESLGERLLPMFTNVAEGLNGVLGVFDSLGSGGQTAAAGIGLIAIALGPVASGIGTILGNSKAILGWFGNLKTKVADAGGVLGTFSGHWRTIAGGVGLTATIAGAGFVIDKFSEGVNRAKDNWSGLIEASKEGPESLHATMQRLNERIQEIGNQPWWQRAWNNAFGDTRYVNEQFDQTIDRINRTDEVLRKVSEQTGVTWYDLRRLAQVNKVDLSEGTAEAQEKLRALAIGTGDAKAPLQALGDTASDTAGDFDQLKEVLSSVFDPILGWDESQLRFEEQVAQIDELLANQDMKADERQRRANQAAQQQLDGYQRQIEKLAEMNGTEEQATAVADAHVAQLQRLQDQFPGLREQIQRYIDRINSVRERVSTDFRAATPNGQVDAYQANLRETPRDITTTMHLNTGPILNLQKLFPGMASGGPFHAGQWSVVGEEGPELVRFGSTGRVYDTATSRQLVSASSSATAITQKSTVIVNVTGSVMSERDLVAAVEQGLARRQRQGGTLAFAGG